MAGCFVGAYWSARPEGRDACASRLHRFLVRLSAEHPAFARWYKQGWSRKQAIASPIKIDGVSLEKLLKTNNRETNRMPILELGFSFDAWNGDFDDGVSVHVHCGGYSKFVGNAAVLNLPEKLGELDALVSKLEQILIEVWEPESTAVGQADGTIVRKALRGGAGEKSK